MLVEMNYEQNWIQKSDLITDWVWYDYLMVWILQDILTKTEIECGKIKS